MGHRHIITIGAGMHLLAGILDNVPSLILSKNPKVDALEPGDGEQAIAGDVLDDAVVIRFAGRQALTGTVDALQQLLVAADAKAEKCPGCGEQHDGMSAGLAGLLGELFGTSRKDFETERASCLKSFEKMKELADIVPGFGKDGHSKLMLDTINETIAGIKVAEDFRDLLDVMERGKKMAAEASLRRSRA